MDLAFLGVPEEELVSSGLFSLFGIVDKPTH